MLLKVWCLDGICFPCWAHHADMKKGWSIAFLNPHFKMPGVLLSTWSVSPSHSWVVPCQNRTQPQVDLETWMSWLNLWARCNMAEFSSFVLVRVADVSSVNFVFLWLPPDGSIYITVSIWNFEFDSEFRVSPTGTLLDPYIYYQFCRR